MRPFHSLATLALAAGTSFGALLVACSSDNSNAPPPVYGEDAGDATTGGNSDASPDTSTTDDGGGSPDTGGSSSGGSTASDAGDSGTRTDAEAGPPACAPVLTDAGCWTCPTATDGSVEFLNQCYGTGVHCVPFDNLAKLPGYDAGLPPLN